MAQKTKIRINELARELEVKAHYILELLPDVGIAEKKTHSSSVEGEAAEKVRKLILRKSKSAEKAQAPAKGAAKPKKTANEPVAETKLKAAPAKASSIAKPSIPSGRGGTPLRPPVQVLRPPLRQQAPHPSASAAKPASAPEAPQIPVARAPATTPSPAEPIRRRVPTLPGGPAAPPATSGAARPVKPIPTQTAAAGPTQGPRAPLAVKEAPAFPGAPIRPPVSRTAPRAPRWPPAPSVRPSAPRLGARSGATTATSPVGRAGAAKPVLIPGKPIYERARRPSSAVPGMPVSRPAGPGFSRPMHPTGRGPGPGAPGYRPHGGRRPGRPHARSVRDREAEREAKVLGRTTARVALVPPKAVNTEITVSEGMTVKELAEKLGIKANLVIKTLVDRGLFATINQTLDLETLNDLCKQFGATTTEVSFEEEAMQEVEESEATGDLQPRAPVVTVMGHVDHGKTSLLDAMRETNVAEREAGGITQAIGAYHVEHNGRKIVFVDTPGHEAFTRMRARGAEVTDVVILVVAADDGVMPQTLEAIDHAKSAEVPILVAINKIDKPDAEPERVKQQLADRGLLPEDWGGDTVMVPVSATEKQNLDGLLEMVLLVADLREPKANPTRPAVGTVIESKLDRGQGPVASVLVQNGTLRCGDYFVVGSVFGKVRAMIDDSGQKVTEAPPATAVVVLGLEGLPAPGDSFQVVTDTGRAKKIVDYRENKAREQALAKSSRLSLEQFQEQLKAGEVKELPIVLKCDVQGSAEVLSDALERLSNEKVKVRLIHTGVGAISESDLLLATAANAIIIGFSVRPERSAAVMADRDKVDIRLYTVIYELIDEIKRAMQGLLDPVLKETFLGHADVLETFRASKVGTVAGCLVQEGRVTKNAEVRLLRDSVVVFTGKLGSLRRFKDDVNEVRSGQECGMGIENFNDVKKGDVIEAFVTEKVADEIFV